MAKTKIEIIEGRVLLVPSNENLVVRDPETFEKLPMIGAQKILNSYWQKRINDGSVQILTNEVE